MIIRFWFSLSYLITYSYVPIRRPGPTINTVWEIFFNFLRYVLVCSKILYEKLNFLNNKWKNIYTYPKMWVVIFIRPVLILTEKVSIIHRFNWNQICFKLHCNPLQGNYRFFTGISLCSNSTLTCFGSVQGLKGQISLKYMHSIQELAFHIYIQVYGFITGISLFFEKQQHGNLIKQGKPCKLNIKKL